MTQEQAIEKWKIDTTNAVRLHSESKRKENGGVMAQSKPRIKPITMKEVDAVAKFVLDQEEAHYKRMDDMAQRFMGSVPTSVAHIASESKRKENEDG